MTPDLPSSRHLKPEGLEQYLATGAPALVPIPGDPKAMLVVNPPAQIGIRLPDSGEIASVADYRFLSIKSAVDPQGSWIELDVTGSDLLMEAYPVLCSIVDRVQLEGKPAHTAIAEALAAYHQLLSRPKGMSEQQEVGLIGELMILRYLIKTLGDTDAVQSWQGPKSEEHDFALTSGDVEVKTTLLESRRHWISSVTQLQPSLERPLWLLSIQLTHAGQSGVSLPGLVGELKDLIVDGSARHTLEAGLERAGWREESAHRFSDTYRLRTAPALYQVDSLFPAITASVLGKSGLRTEHILELAYLIDLTGIDPAPAIPVELEHIIEGEAS